MKILYFECNMGAAGDMLMSALYELLPNKQGFINTLNNLLPNVSVSAEDSNTCGIKGTRIKVTIAGKAEESIDLPRGTTGQREPEHEHVRAHLNDIYSVINGFPLPAEVKQNACAVYKIIADAESHVHGIPVTHIHFHEVGALDAVLDITGVSLALYILSPDSVQVSPIQLGSGQLICSHGVLPIPAPATAHILKGTPCYGGEINGELCTPTGAALLKYFGNSFGQMPMMAINDIGYGIGNKEFQAANCVRAFFGEAIISSNAEVVELCCNIDDMTAEALAFASEQLMAYGALDVSSTPITMKKGRAGIAFTVLCRTEDEMRMARAILSETSTNGVRARCCRKYMLISSSKTVETSFGPVQVKCADGFGVHHEKAEYESVAAIARKNDLPFQKAWEDVLSQVSPPVRERV